MHDDATFTVMGGRARVLVHGDDASRHVAWARSRLAELEQRWSRFRPDSELSGLNRAAGRWVDLSADTFCLVELAVHAWAATGGLFDPTLLGQLVALGYDRTHTDLAPPSEPARPTPAGGGRGSDSDPGGRHGATTPGRAGPRVSRCGDIQLDRESLAVALPPGSAVDPGGIGKGLAADMVATELMARGARGALVELAGDLRIVGDHPHDGPVWTVQVDDPADRGRELFRLGFGDGGIATSSRLQRRWSTADGDRHHLVDPRTGLPSTGEVASAVVATGSAWWAEVLAKAALLAGIGPGRRLLAEAGAVGVLFDDHGQAHDARLLAQAEAVHLTAGA